MVMSNLTPRDAIFVNKSGLGNLETNFILLKNRQVKWLGGYRVLLFVYFKLFLILIIVESENNIFTPASFYIRIK